MEVRARRPHDVVMPETDTDDAQVVYSWPKNSSEEIRATIRWFKGYRLADIRVYRADADDVDHPTRKGICVRVGDLSKLKAAVDALIEATAQDRAA
jgi:hypothetical protein